MTMKMMHGQKDLITIAQTCFYVIDGSEKYQSKSIEKKLLPNTNRSFTGVLTTSNTSLALHKLKAINFSRDQPKPMNDLKGKQKIKLKKMELSCLLTLTKLVHQ